jgi:hypothetical protein
VKWLTDRRVRSLQQQLQTERGRRREAEAAVRDARGENVRLVADYESQIELMQNALVDEERDHAKTAEALKDLERLTIRGAA